MRLIDADALLKELPKEYLGSIVHMLINSAPSIELDTEAEQIARRIATILENEQDMRVILSQPTIDAVSVVRCAECRWSRPRTLKGETGYRCVFYRVDKAENGYCDCGERKESE